MLQVITSSCSITGGDYARGGAASSLLKERLKRIGAGAEVVRRAMIAAYEAEMNVVVHARKGVMTASLTPGRLDVEVADEGPGIADIEQAMKEGFSTAPAEARELGFGAGMGLPNIKKSSDAFAIASEPGRGTRVTFTVLLKAEEAAEEERSPLVVGAGCRSCMRCVTACPAQAVRVRSGAIEVLEHLCCGCAECVRVCGSGVFSPSAAELPQDRAGWTLVAPPELLTQFPGASAAEALKALGTLGFAGVMTTGPWREGVLSAAAELAAEAAAELPVISPVCEAVVKLIQTRFPSMLGRIAPLLTPTEAARRELAERRCVFVTLCPGMSGSILSARAPGEAGAMSPRPLRGEMMRALEGRARAPRPVRPPLPQEARGALTVTGLGHVARVLELAERGELGGIRVLELYACDGGCAGSPLLWQPYPLAALAGAAAGPARPALRREAPLRPRKGVRLDENMAEAVRKLGEIDRLTRGLPGRDCGFCGAPTCSTLAEDVVLGRCDISACVHAKDPGR